MKRIGFFILLLAGLSAFAAGPMAFRLTDGKGRKASYQKMLRAAFDADVVFFGELHNNPISHWLQLELSTALADRFGDKLVLGAEMFETDNQQALSDFLANAISRDSLQKAARLWPNYKTDIEPLVLLSRQRNIPFIATNVPRRYASLVFRQGFEALDMLPDEEKVFIAPLPVDYDPELPSYKAMLEMMAGHGQGPNVENFPKAQAIKDATMAWFIHKNLKPGQKMIHFNGAYHTDNFEGIVWYLRRLRPEFKIMVITTIEAAQPLSFPADKKGVADFVVLVPENMTKTH
ncbi:MAG TPA: ChaN family lipoprotein [Bacteroidales bacterium]|nr:ChaN family lipoprotein [Bacteroidales bacterium]